jgi:hypothetical protein
MIDQQVVLQVMIDQQVGTAGDFNYGVRGS